MRETAPLEVLVPGALAGTMYAPDDDAGLLALFDDPPPRAATGAHVRAVMLASLDGAATGSDARSGSLGDAADRRPRKTLGWKSPARALAQLQSSHS